MNALNHEFSSAAAWMRVSQKPHARPASIAMPRPKNCLPVKFQLPRVPTISQKNIFVKYMCVMEILYAQCSWREQHVTLGILCFSFPKVLALFLNTCLSIITLICWSPGLALIAMKVTQQFVDNLCCRLKLIGAPKVSWLQTGFLIFGNQLKLNLLPNLRWFIFKLCFFFPPTRFCCLLYCLSSGLISPLPSHMRTFWFMVCIGRCWLYCYTRDLNEYIHVGSELFF